MPEQHIWGYLQLALAAGNETTQNAITGGVHALLEHPDQAQMLAGQRRQRRPDQVGLLKRSCAGPHRSCSSPAPRLEDFELSGVKINAGQDVGMWYPAANRDPKVFDEPYRFDITAQPQSASRLRRVRRTLLSGRQPGAGGATGRVCEPSPRCSPRWSWRVSPSAVPSCTFPRSTVSRYARPPDGALCPFQRASKLPQRRERCPTPTPPMTYSSSSGTIVDGTGLPSYRGDIAIRDGRIDRIGLIDAPADSRDRRDRPDRESLASSTCTRTTTRSSTGMGWRRLPSQHGVTTVSSRATAASRSIPRSPRTSTG